MKLLRTTVLASGLGAAAVVLGACSSGPAKPSDPVLAQGQEIYNRSCASCHGTKGQGGLGPALQGVSNRLTFEQEVETVAKGRKGTQMQAWEGKLTPEEIQAVVRYTRESLKP